MHRITGKQQVVGLLAWLAVTGVAAFAGSMASRRSQDFYGLLEQPAWAPPPEVFGPVWTVLYILMAVAAWLVWRVGGFERARTALTLYLVQLVVNALWSWLFFAWQMGGAALADIALMWVLVAATMLAFWKHSRVAALMLLPYLAWISFAAMLNLKLWQANPGVLG
ncbi:TspO/MBR family protein [Luteimonas sp. MC1895]|uniref:TspO/MBR family protein n=1 Tax=Luteimonas sp. MC1895 TaxID=2819513 RepID=UPI0018F0C5B5|nr:TspO/MBR family protein [Luteimonas sp. MC1895]MBJ6979913.1 tryptophan-rich sensory protein [Luteimonas sp. MC1895]